MADLITLQSNAKQEMSQTIEAFKNEMQKVRIGAVNVESIKNIQVESYGAKVPMYQLSTITSPSATAIVITPWDKGILKDIATAIDIEFKKEVQPNIKDNAVYLNFPPLTQEKKEEFVKLLKEKGEQFRQRLRDVRQSIKSQIEEVKKEGSVSEDEIFKSLEQLDEVTKQFTDEISQIYEDKKVQLLK